MKGREDIGRHHKKSTGNDDGESGNKKRPMRQTKEKRRLPMMVFVVSGQRNTRSIPNINTSGSGRGKIPKALLSYFLGGPREEQVHRLINPGLCNIRGCELKNDTPKIEKRATEKNNNSNEKKSNRTRTSGRGDGGIGIRITSWQEYIDL